MSWLLATWLGWLLGVPCIVLLALAAEAVHLGGLQVFVGTGMGLGVGLLQARQVRRCGLSARSWILASALGLGLPFLAWDVAAAMGTTWTYYLAGCVATGGLVVGLCQGQLLKRHLVAPAWWVVGCTLGWGLAGGLTTTADLLVKGLALRGLPGAAAYLALVALPGGVLGLVTARVLAATWRPAVGQ